MDTSFTKIKNFLHRHPKLRKAVRWTRWQLKRVPLVDRASIAFDKAYFRGVGEERPASADDKGVVDEYAEAYSQFILERVHGAVLDVGCGHGYLTERIARDPRVTDVVGVDKVHEFHRQHPKVQYISRDLPGAEDFSGAFDVVVSNEFVEHITEDDHRAILAKITKVLKPGGIYIGSTPRNPTSFKVFSGSRFHVREYNERDLKSLLEEYFSDVTVKALSLYCLAWEAKNPKSPRRQGGTLKLHLGCGEKYLEGYVNIDFPQTEHTVMSPRVDRVADITKLEYPAGTVSEIRSHHLFEHFSRAEALKLLFRWRRWLTPGGVLVIETPDFTTSATMFLHSSSLRRRFQLSRHIYGSQEAGWATHKDYWDKEKFKFILSAVGFREVTVRNYWNGLAHHADKIPKVGKVFVALPEALTVPTLNVLGNLLPESFYKKYGSNKMPNILARAVKDEGSHVDEEVIVRKILSLYLTGKEGKALLDVWMDEYHNF